MKKLLMTACLTVLTGSVYAQKILTLEQLQQKRKAMEEQTSPKDDQEKVEKKDLKLKDAAEKKEVKTTKGKKELQDETANVKESTSKSELKNISDYELKERRGKLNYAQPEMAGEPGPFPANMDFYYISATGPVGVSFIAGDPDILRQPGKANLYFDVSRVQYGKTNFFEDYRKVEKKDDVLQVLSSATDYFTAQFNRKNKDGRYFRIERAKTFVNSPHAVIIRLRKLNKGNASGFWLDNSIKSGAATIDGTLEVIELKSGKILAVYGFNNISGSNFMSKDIRAGLAFSELGTKLRKLVRGSK